MAYLYPLAMTAWYIYIARLWLLFYSIKFNMETIKGKWQTIIDPDNTTKLQWFRRRRVCLGTQKAASVAVVIYCFLVAILVVVIRVLTDENREDGLAHSTMTIIFCVIHSVAFVVPFLLILFVVCSIPRHY